MRKARRRTRKAIKRIRLSRSQVRLLADLARRLMRRAEAELYEDSDECEWKQGEDSLSCVQKSGKKCAKGKCVNVRVTVKRDGVKKTLNWCTCSDL